MLQRFTPLNLLFTSNSIPQNMTSIATQSVEIVTFKCEEWVATRTTNGELISVKPIGGTWTLVSGEDRQRFAEQHKMSVKAFFACPRCEQIGIIPESFNPPTQHGDTEILPELHCRRCDYSCRVILEKWDQRKLYCACYETRDGDTLKPHKQYLHAVDEAEATKFFWAQHGLEVTNLVGIAPALGFFLPNPKDDRVLVV